MSKIVPSLWYAHESEEAANLYVSFGLPDSGIDRVQRSPSDYPGGKAGDVLTVEFRLGGQSFVAINGGSPMPFTHAVSFTIPCEDQAEVDRLWDRILSSGGKEVQCGWITDKFGLSWQITPKALPRLLASPDPAVAKRVMERMMSMVKLDIAELERAAAGA